jgi:hypothetical protein
VELATIDLFWRQRAVGTATKSKPRKSLRDEVAAVLKTRDGKRLSGRAIARKLGRSTGQVSAIVREIRGRKAEVIMPSSVPAEVQDTSPLSVDEAAELQAQEAVVERGMTGFVEVAAALSVIRDKRLYRQTHPTFETYCRERWDFTRQHVNRLIAAVGVVGNLEPMGSKPNSERQVRPISDLPPSQQRKVWDEAVAQSNGHAPTARKVREVRAAVAPKPKGKGKPEKPAPKPDPKSVDAALEDEDEEAASERAAIRGADGIKAEAEDGHGRPKLTPTEREWLETVPLRAKLANAPRCLAILDRDSIAWYRAWLAPPGHLDALKKRGVTEDGKAGQTQGAWQYLLSRLLRTAAPHAWLQCKAKGCKDGIVGSAKCQSCYGRGYVIPGVGGN